MAAQNLTAAALLDLQGRISEIFAEGIGPSSYDRNYSIDIQTARAMLRNHVAETSPLKDAFGNCQGFKVYHLRGREDSLYYSGDGDTLRLDCEIPSGDGVIALETSYSLNAIDIVNREVDDALCGNLFRDNVSADTRDEAATLIARNLEYGVHTIGRNLNRRFINLLNTGKTPVNKDTSLPTGITYNVATDEFEINETLLPTNNPDTLTEVETVAQNNDMTNWFIIAGRNHYRNAAINSQWKVLNDDQRSEIRWQQQNLYFDQKNIDSILGGKNSFVVDPGSYIFYDHVDDGLSFEPVQVDYNTWEFMLEDPVLMVNTPRGPRPLRYTVHYQKVCGDVNTTRMRNQFKHRFRIILNAGLHLSPPGPGGHTGILKFVTV